MSYSCEPIAASVRFKVPQVVVMPISRRVENLDQADLTVLAIGSALSNQKHSSPEAFGAGDYKDETGNRSWKVSGTQGIKWHHRANGLLTTPENTITYYNVISLSPQNFA